MCKMKSSIKKSIILIITVLIFFPSLFNTAHSKAPYKSTDIEKWRKSTPGIFVRKFSNNQSVFTYFKSLEFFNPIFLINENDVEIVNSCFTVNEFKTLAKISNFLYIIPAYNLRTEDSNLFQRIKDLKDIKFLTLSKINRLEDNFLYINFRLDLLKKLN